MLLSTTINLESIFVNKFTISIMTLNNVLHTLFICRILIASFCLCYFVFVIYHYTLSITLLVENFYYYLNWILMVSNKFNGFNIFSRRILIVTVDYYSNMLPISYAKLCRNVKSYLLHFKYRKTERVSPK